jgi:hypothetical protein
MLFFVLSQCFVHSKRIFDYFCLAGLQGNQKFEAGLYYDAVTLYSKAIALIPDSALYYSNRSAA